MPLWCCSSNAGTRCTKGHELARQRVRLARPQINHAGFLPGHRDGECRRHPPLLQRLRRRIGGIYGEDSRVFSASCAVDEPPLFLIAHCPYSLSFGATGNTDAETQFIKTVQLEWHTQQVRHQQQCQWHRDKRQRGLGGYDRRHYRCVSAHLLCKRVGAGGGRH